ncbi:MAG: carbohydrate kinase [Bacteroidaceae bacterium]|nr:carbohydrate kinase [Bacteroidaceae bacterium]
MRKVIGIGETILDIIIRDGKPTGAVPGGSTFNTMVSLGRMDTPAVFLTDLGDDHVGSVIREFMKDNGVDDTFVSVWPDKQSPVSLAFLDKDNNAQYEFYRQPFPTEREPVLPEVTADDVVVFGSYYALDPATRPSVAALLSLARERGALIVYDVNFRVNHRAEAVKLTGTLLENLEFADIIRGSNEDFRILYGLADSEAVYKQQTAFYCPRLVYTCGAEGVRLHAGGGVSRSYESLPVPALVSTIGAGDSFNAGLIYGLLRYRVRRADLDNLTADDWDHIIGCALAFAANTCQSLENYVDRGFQVK